MTLEHPHFPSLSTHQSMGEGDEHGVEPTYTRRGTSLSFHLDKDFHLHYLKTHVDKVGRSIFVPVTPLELECWKTREPVPFTSRKSGEHSHLKVGDKWGELWDCAWMHLQGELPETPKDCLPVLLIDVEGEACIYDVDGRPILGLTHMQKPLFIFPQGKKVHWLSPQSPAGSMVEFWLEAGANDLFGKPNSEPQERVTLGHLALAHLGHCRPAMRELYYDLLFLRDLLEVLPKTRTRYHRILRVMTDAVGCLRDYTNDEALRACKILAPEVHRKGPAEPSLTLHTIGHAHLDLAWLWPIRETRRKGVRSYATVLSNMERYPEYIFTSSQPQLLDWIRKDSPDLFARIQERVKEGRWELQGGMWVEADNTMSGGEALARQFLHGQRFFEEHFDVRTNVLWLPDCFGYSAQLPQIASLGGMKYFMTIKPSWNLFNKLPFSTFVWQGLDGTEILSHMPPADCYNTPATPVSLALAEEQFQDKAISDRALLVFGVGDGGGGPGAEHLEALRREQNTEGLPATCHGRADAFYELLETKTDQFNRWSGEIYLERHQGTFTSQAWNKRFNRMCEVLLHQVELLSILRLYGGSVSYPREALNTIWRDILLFQFHDILPGSSIGRVHRESQQRYREIVTELESMLGMQEPSDTPPDSLVALNSLSWDREIWLRVASGWTKAHLPALGIAKVTASDLPDRFEKMVAGVDVLSNGIITIRFETDGSISSLYDHGAKRELVPSDDFLNRLVLFDDWWAGDSSDAWDISPSYRERPVTIAHLEEATWSLDGPVATRRHVYRIGESRIEQDIVLTEGSRRIDFVTRIHWEERGKMLRTLLPVDLHTDYARCEIQFGHVIRPVHQNTTQDMARFEVSAQKWVDLSQADYGIALLNNGKYGHSLHKGRLELNLLRSPNYPDPDADSGHHEFTYSLFPHRGDPVNGRVVQAAYELNQPVRLLDSNTTPPLADLQGESFLRINTSQVILEGIKLAEDGDSVIVRLYEIAGGHCNATLKSAYKLKSAQLTNILEEESGEASYSDDTVELTFRPFEIKTVRLVLDQTKGGAIS